MSVRMERYHDQHARWPKDGRHILAQFDDETIIVYQAYRPEIGRYAIEHGRFGGEFRYSRMSWVKTNFLWMMYRSGWGTKTDQEVTLALRLRRSFFDSLLMMAIPSTWNPLEYPQREDWAQAVESSSVRLQWDPDHHPTGAPLERRAIQMGMRGDVLAAFGRTELLEVIDLSDFVAEQRANLAHHGTTELITPCEHVYRPINPSIARRLRLDSLQSGDEHASALDYS